MRGKRASTRCIARLIKGTCYTGFASGFCVIASGRHFNFCLRAIRYERACGALITALFSQRSSTWKHETRKRSRVSTCVHELYGRVAFVVHRRRSRPFVHPIGGVLWRTTFDVSRLIRQESGMIRGISHLMRSRRFIFLCASVGRSVCSFMCALKKRCRRPATTIRIAREISSLSKRAS